MERGEPPCSVVSRRPPRARRGGRPRAMAGTAAGSDWAVVQLHVRLQGSHLDEAQRLQGARLAAALAEGGSELSRKAASEAVLASGGEIGARARAPPLAYHTCPRQSVVWRGDGVGEFAYVLELPCEVCL